MLEKLDAQQRLKLLRVVAAAAWMDGEVHEKERAFVERLLDKLPISAPERKQALQYLDKPPHPAEADPSRIPPDHRRALLDIVHGLVGADGHLDDSERECLEVLESVLG